LKLVAWRKKMPSDLHQRASLPSELLSLDLLRPFVLEKDELLVCVGRVVARRRLFRIELANLSRRRIVVCALNASRASSSTG
jgi:hypothetical protein